MSRLPLPSRRRILKDCSPWPGGATGIEAVAYDYDGREKEPVERCNLCGSEDTVEASTVDRYGFAQPLRLLSPLRARGFSLRASRSASTPTSTATSTARSSRPTTAS